MREQTRRELFRNVAVGVVAGGGIAGTAAGEENASSRVVGESSMPQYDSGHTGYVPDIQGPTTDPGLIWQYSTGDPISTSPAVADGVVYVTSGSDLYALDGADGSENWQFGADEAITTSPTAVTDTVYVTSEEGTLYAVEATTGKLLWSASVGDTPSDPIIADESVFVTGGGTFYLLNERGEQEDAVDLTGEVASAPAVEDDAVFVGTDEGVLYRFTVDRSTGSPSLVEDWELDTVIERVPTMTVKNDTVYVAGSAPAETNQGRVYALDSDTGEERWSFAETPWIHGSVAIAAGTVYVGFDNGDVVAVDASTGNEQWRFDANSSWSFLFWGPGVSSSPVVADDTLYIGSEDANLYSLDAATGEEKWRFTTSDDVVGIPTVIDGVVYAGNEAGRVYAITDSETSPVPLADVDFDAGDGSSSGVISTSTGFIWSLATSPLSLIVGAVIIILLAIGSAQETQTSSENKSGTNSPSESSENKTGTGSPSETTFTADDVPEELREKRQQLQSEMSSFVDQNDLNHRVGDNINVPAPESFGTADSARQRYDTLDKRIHEWKSNWEDVIERRSQLASRIDQLGSDNESTVQHPEIGVPSLSDLTSGHSARKKLDKQETVVSHWETAFDTLSSLDKNSAEKITSGINETLNKSSAASDPEDLAERVSKLTVILERTAALDGSLNSEGVEAFKNQIIEDVSNTGVPDDELLATYEDVIDGVETIVEFLARVDHGHPSVDAEEWRDTANLALTEAYPKILNPLTSRINRMGESLWNHTHLQAYSWEEFESLIGSLYRSQGYEVTVTQGTADLGVDVWAKSNGERVAIQAKQYKRGNTVGRETLQKLASTLAKGDADRIVVVTTSAFAQTAEEYAADFGPEIELIDGDRLLTLLSESDLPPPAENQ